MLVNSITTILCLFDKNRNNLLQIFQKYFLDSDYRTVFSSISPVIQALAHRTKYLDENIKNPDSAVFRCASSFHKKKD